MTISAMIIADSISPQGIRLTTFQLRYPRFIHAEFMTHRMFSRNASSSRAIPVKRLIQDIESDPAIPMHWGKNQSGMQAREEHDLPVHCYDHETDCNMHMPPQEAWHNAMLKAIEFARAFDAAGYHKQIVNRLLEPFSHINVVCTSTNFSNFFTLRDHPDAQPEIQLLAQEMKKAMAGSEANHLLIPGCWHLPYYEDGYWEPYGKQDDVEYDIHGASLEEARSISVARCARVSYRTHDGRIAEHEEEVELCKRLLAQVPLHASPAEHQATPDTWISVHAEGELGMWHHLKEHGNFDGWRQYRKMLAGECQ
ncbi:FAD-dependent thymidylate synthase [Roseococcus sp.]|uniref:FAD-dependent thymidylate synthase n=1 Tax=Roseococcus sp. TaxID=2109646 RepID=UPI003BADAC45